MLFPVRTDRPLRQPPYANWALILLTVLSFIVQLVNRDLMQVLWLDPLDPQPWQWVTYMFCHSQGDPFHILFNLVFLYIFGNSVNDKLGNWGYVAFFLTGGVAAGVAHWATSYHPVVGASGAVSAVTGAFIALFPRARVTVIYWLFFIGVLELPGLWLVGFFFARDLFGLLGGGGGVAFMAHIGGTLFGVTACLALLGGRLLPRDNWDMLAMLHHWNRRRQFQTMVASGYDPFGPSLPKRHEKPDPNRDRVHELRGEISEAVGREDYAGAASLYGQLLRLDDQQVLSPRAQLAIGSWLHGHGHHAEAAQAYEAFLRQYPRDADAMQTRLLLGLLLVRYLEEPEKARPHLLHVRELGHGDERDLAAAELEALPPAPAGALAEASPKEPRP